MKATITFTCDELKEIIREGMKRVPYGSFIHENCDLIMELNDTRILNSHDSITIKWEEDVERGDMS